MNYYYQNTNTERVGPIDEATFFGAVAAGAILPDALVWRNGEPEWCRWADVAESWTPVGVPPACVPAPEESVGDLAVSPDVGMDGLFSDAWKVFKKHCGRLIGASCLVGALSFFAWILMGLAEVFIAPGAEPNSDLLFTEDALASDEMVLSEGEIVPAEEFAANDALGGEFGEETSLVAENKSFLLGFMALYLVIGIGSSFLNTAYTFGVLKLLRKEDAGKPSSFGTLFPIGRTLKKLPSLAIAYVVLVLFPLVFIGVVAGVSAGLLAGSSLGASQSVEAELAASLGSAFIILALYAFCACCWIRMGFAMPIIFDTDSGPFKALKVSWQITRGNFWRTVGYGILCSMIVGAGTVFTLGLGAIVIFPLWMLWFGTYYIKLMKTAKVPVPESVL